MKSLIKITAAITIAIVFSTNLNASSINFSEESYIDDIPFSTTEIYNEIITEQKLAEFDFEEEHYIDDITINTKCISTECKYQRAILVVFSLEEEQFINDMEL